MGLGSARPGGVVNRGVRGPGDGPSYPAPETPSLTLGALAYLGSPGMPHLRPRSDAEALSQPPHQGFPAPIRGPSTPVPESPAGGGCFKSGRPAWRQALGTMGRSLAGMGWDGLGYLGQRLPACPSGPLDFGLSRTASGFI